MGTDIVNTGIVNTGIACTGIGCTGIVDGFVYARNICNLSTTKEQTRPNPQANKLSAVVVRYAIANTPYDAHPPIGTCDIIRNRMF